MTDTPDTTPSSQPDRWRFSLGTLLLWTAIVALLANSLVMHGRMSQLQSLIETQNREIGAMRPLEPKEVARQFEKATTLGSFTTTVKDVRYSPDTDTYKVAFSWTDKTSSQQWYTDVKLEPDGYGTYLGKIRNDPFIKPLGYKDAFVVVVQTPSPL